MAGKKTFGLVDANSFYASCERIFRPDLMKRPVVVLSNNDGCVVTRSSEAKTLGIKNGTPIFKIADLVEREGVAVFSSNYELYGDISHRMMMAAAGVVPSIEPYSIDECFLDLTGLPGPMAPVLGKLRERVFRGVGIPTCVSAAPTKTLAKLANHLAKTYPALGGVLDWGELTPARRRKAMSLVPVSEVWGIGPRIAPRLASLGAASALDFIGLPEAEVRNRFGVVTSRIQLELKGEPCLEIEPSPPTRKQIIRSRSFGNATEDRHAVEAAVASHVAEAARVMREEGVAASLLRVYFHTNYFNVRAPQYTGSGYAAFTRPTSDTLALTLAAAKAVRKAWKKGFAIKKAGVLLTGLELEGRIEPDLFMEEESGRSRALMDAVDALNRRFGRGTVSTASAVASDAWRMTRARMSPRYTTRWEEIPGAA